MKKLMIKFVKFEKAFAMQVLEQEGLPVQKDCGNVKIISFPALHEDILFLRGEYKDNDLNVASKQFAHNKERDEFIRNVINSITTELFTSNGELKVGELVEVSDVPDFRFSWIRELIAILPEDIDSRYIARAECCIMNWRTYKYARPLLQESEPKIERNGDIILATWEEK